MLTITRTRPTRPLPLPLLFLFLCLSQPIYLRKATPELTSCNKRITNPENFAVGTSGCTIPGQWCDQSISAYRVCRFAPIGKYTYTSSFFMEEIHSCATNYTTLAIGTFVPVPAFDPTSLAASLVVCSCQQGWVRSAPGDLSSRCISCPIDKYSNAVADGDGGTCVGCSAGNYLAVSAAWSETNPSRWKDQMCFTCGGKQYTSDNGAYGPSRKEACICNVGYEREVAGNTNSICISCRVGHYKPQTGNHACTPCGANTATAVVGATACAACDAGLQAGVGYSVCNLTMNPTGQPSAVPSMAPTGQPTSVPSSEPSAQPTCQPSIPTGQPTSGPTTQPTSQPTTQPTTQPTSRPSAPSGQPTGQPSTRPSGQPTGQPTSPTGQPTASPTAPTSFPTGEPTGQPTSQPSTSYPTGQPTIRPTTQPSGQPSSDPTGQPSSMPSALPSAQPTSSPSTPTGQPTSHPTSAPSITPDFSPVQADLWWKQTFYISMAALFLFVSMGTLYYFSDRKLTFKYMFQFMLGCDKTNSEYMCYCIKKSAAELQKLQELKERRELASYIPLDQLEAGRTAVMDGTVQKQERIPLSQRGKITPSSSLRSVNLDEDERHAIPAPTAESLQKWGDKKMAFAKTTGVSDIAYRGGRGKNAEDMRMMNTAEQVLTMKRVLGAMAPHQTTIGSGHGAKTLSLLERDGVHASKLTVEGEEKQVESFGPLKVMRNLFKSPFKIAPTLANSLHDEHGDELGHDEDDAFSGVTPQAVLKCQANFRKVVNMRELTQRADT